jgi:hypothetical protein
VFLRDRPLLFLKLNYLEIYFLLSFDYNIFTDNLLLFHIKYMDCPTLKYIIDSPYSYQTLQSMMVLTVINEECIVVVVVV